MTRNVTRRRRGNDILASALELGDTLRPGCQRRQQLLGLDNNV
jgi:hypothetical protein